MKVQGPGSPLNASSPKGVRGAASGGFGLSAPAQAGGAAGPARAAPAAGAMSVDALVALQAADGPLERRRRAVGRAGRLLDMLDEVKLALLDGASLSGPALQNLARVAREQRAATDDPRLEGVLDEIETRAAVELAKAEMSRLAA